MRINIMTVFPRFFEEPLRSSIVGRAERAGLVSFRVVDLRDHTTDRHRTVDALPYGGGAGMVLKPEPFFEAVESVQPRGPVVLLSARGRPFSHADAVRFDQISHDEAIGRNLQVMDQTAFTLCRDRGMRVVVFDLRVAQNLVGLIEGTVTGTVVTRD